MFIFVILGVLLGHYMSKVQVKIHFLLILSGKYS